MGKTGINPNTWTKSSLATAIPSASQVPAESGTPPVDQPLAAVTPATGMPGEILEENTYCRGSSTGGSSSRRTAPPQHGRRCGHRHHICCHLPSSAWWFCVPSQAGGEKGRPLLNTVSSTTLAPEQLGLQAPLNQICEVCVASEHNPTISSTAKKCDLPLREKFLGPVQLPSSSDARPDLKA